MLCRHCDCEITPYDLDYGKIDECRHCAVDVERYVGHMVWDHKTAPALEIHANAKSLAALKDGKARDGGQLVHEVKERSRRRESDITCGDLSRSPYIRKDFFPIMEHNAEDLPHIELRAGTGKTVATFGRSVLDSSVKLGDDALKHLSGEKKLLAKAAAKIPSQKISGKSITVWKDEIGFYIHPKKSVVSSRLDCETLKQLGYRTSNYSRF
jgi:hypothetical protein